MPKINLWTIHSFHLTLQRFIEKFTAMKAYDISLWAIIHSKIESTTVFHTSYSQILLPIVLSSVYNISFLFYSINCHANKVEYSVIILISERSLLIYSIKLKQLTIMHNFIDNCARKHQKMKLHTNKMFKNFSRTFLVRRNKAIRWFTKNLYRIIYETFSDSTL